MPAIAHDYPEDLQALREGIASFIKAEVIPRHERNTDLFDDPRKVYDEKGAFTPRTRELIREVRMASGRAGYYAMATPESLGGGGMGYLAYFAAWEKIFHLCGMHHWLGHYMVSHWAKGPSPVLAEVTPELLKNAMPKLVSGEHSMCFGMSEPGAGSDVQMVKTRAEPDGKGWRITGSKIWISNSPYAEWVIVFAVTNSEAATKRTGGISAFMVPTSSPGFSIDRLINMWGHVGTDEAVLRFENVRVEPEQLVGKLDKGFRIGMLGVGLGRVYNSARSIGLSKWALEQAIEYTKVRESFGKKISEYQGVTFPLAESAMQVHAAHLVARNACGLLDQGKPATKELSMAKAYAVEVGKLAVDRAMQTHGAMGFTNEMHLSEAYITLRKINVADGTNEILRRTIWRQLANGDIDL